MQEIAQKKLGTRQRAVTNDTTGYYGQWQQKANNCSLLIAAQPHRAKGREPAPQILEEARRRFSK